MGTPEGVCHFRVGGNPMRILKTLQYSKKGKAHKTHKKITPKPKILKTK
ncbi:MAG: hypothetical protein LBS26_04870 [Campylobacteraceae bacterium]|jgi:hypothetical protein|nr:hypothetical protein [Campylobacteraceae bacterium]